MAMSLGSRDDRPTPSERLGEEIAGLFTIMLILIALVHIAGMIL